MAKLDDPHHRHDKYFKRAREQGFAARSVFKLEEIDRKLRLIRPGHRVLDLGCRPGSWMQYAVDGRRAQGRGGRDRSRSAAGADRRHARAGGRSLSRPPTPSCSVTCPPSTSCSPTWRPTPPACADRPGALGGAVRGGAGARRALAGARRRIRRQDLPGPGFPGLAPAHDQALPRGAHHQARQLARAEHRDLPGGARVRVSTEPGPGEDGRNGHADRNFRWATTPVLG